MFFKNRSKKSMLSAVLLLSGCLLQPLTLAAQSDTPPKNKENKVIREDELVGKRETEISYDKIVMDFKKGVANLTGNVIVDDGTMTLTADKMLVEFAEGNKLKRVTATDNVVILQPQDDRRATAGQAIYEVASGDITLTIEPVLTDGTNVMHGVKKIIYNRDSSLVTTEGRGSIKFIPESQDSAAPRDLPKESETDNGK